MSLNHRILVMQPIQEEPVMMKPMTIAERVIRQFRSELHSLKLDYLRYHTVAELIAAMREAGHSHIVGVIIDV